MKTWKVLVPFEADGSVELCCSNCDRWAHCPTKGRMMPVAAIGMRLIFDPPGSIPPEDYLPSVIQCRGCRHVFEQKDPDVRKAV
jgi:hypothetical protein